MIIFGVIIFRRSKKSKKSLGTVAGYTGELAELHEHRMQEIRNLKAKVDEKNEY